MTNEVRFEASDVEIAPRTLTRIPLQAVSAILGIALDDGEVRFMQRGWYEVLLTVEWTTHDREGHRFAHTAIPDSHPLHSEAIEADLLADLSGGRQLLRGNTIFDPNTPIRSLALEVWHGSSKRVGITHASIALRPSMRKPHRLCPDRRHKADGAVGAIRYRP
jgi:hypothetical protein